MLAEFFEVLSKIRALRTEKRWSDAGLLADQQFENLVGLRGAEVAALTETELLARLIQGESTLAVREKTLILATLLKEAGDNSTAQGSDDEARRYYLQGLHLLLGVLARDDVSNCPEFVPSVELFRSALESNPLPLATQALLMQHYELSGQFAKAEDCLFNMLEGASDNRELLDFGIAFYQRLQTRTDDALLTGELPRNEVVEGLSELSARRSAAKAA